MRVLHHILPVQEKNKVQNWKHGFYCILLSHNCKVENCDSGTVCTTEWKECDDIHTPHVVKSWLTALEGKRDSSPATGAGERVPGNGQLLGALWWAKGRGRKPMRRRLQG